MESKTVSDTGDQNHYFEKRPVVPEVRSTFTVESDKGTLHLESSSGVFSRHGLDKGTGVFLDTMRRSGGDPPPAGSHLCDLGCGSGVLALVMAAAHPDCTVHAIDVNERARTLCAENARRNGLDNVVVESPDEVDPAIRFQILWSNPPIRIGKTAVHDLLRVWLHRLTPTGRADLVVARNLGSDSLAEWISHLGFRVTRLASSKGFRVLRVSGAPEQRAPAP